MANGTTSSKKTENSIDAIVAAAYKKYGFYYKPAKKNPINASGSKFERKVNSKIKSFTGFKSNPQHRILFTASESVIAFGKKSLVIDELITSEACGKTLYAEVKFQNVNGTVDEKNFKNVYLFTHLKKQELFIVSGKFYNKEYIDSMNDSFLETGTLDYIYMVHESELEKCLNIWKEQPKTNFFELHALMSK